MTEEEKVIIINLEALYKDAVDEWAVYDNSSEWPVLIEEGGKCRRSKKRHKVPSGSLILISEMPNWLYGGPLCGRERGRGVSATGL